MTCVGLCCQCQQSIIAAYQLIDLPIDGNYSNAYHWRNWCDSVINHRWLIKCSPDRHLNSSNFGWVTITSPRRDEEEEEKKTKRWRKQNILMRFDDSRHVRRCSPSPPPPPHDKERYRGCLSRHHEYRITFMTRTWVVFRVYTMRIDGLLTDSKLPLLSQWIAFIISIAVAMMTYAAQKKWSRARRDHSV